MKLALGLLLFQSFIELNAQNIIKANALSIFAGIPNFQFERAISDRATIQLGLLGGGVRYANEASRSGHSALGVFAFTPEVRYYLGYQKHAAPKGFFMGAHMRGRYGSMRWGGTSYDPDTDQFILSENHYRVWTLGMGGTAGYQFHLGKRLSLELFAGPQFMIGTPKFSAACATCNGNERLRDLLGPDWTGLEVRAAACIGYRFE